MNLFNSVFSIGAKRKHNFDDRSREHDTETVEKRTSKRTRNNRAVEPVEPAQRLPDKHQIGTQASFSFVEEGNEDKTNEPKTRVNDMNADIVSQSSSGTEVTLRNDIEISKSSHESRHEEVILQARLAEVQACNILLESRDKCLIARVDDLTASKSLLDAELRRQGDSITALTAKVSRMKEDKAELEAKVKIRDGRIMNLTDINGMLENRVKELEAHIREKT